MSKAFSNDNVERKDALNSLRKQVVKAFDDKDFKNNYLKTKESFKNLLKYEDSDKNLIHEFNGFTTYFEKFFKIREHVFLGNTYGSIAYRLIDENLKIYRNNVEKTKKIPDELKLEITDIGKIDNLSGYKSYITQSAITGYNEILGGIASADGTKMQGINEKINLYCQKNKIKLPRLEPLYKMILSDIETSSFILDVIENDISLIEMVMETLQKTSLSGEIMLSEKDNIFIKFNQLGNLPGANYSLVSSLILKDYDGKHATVKRRKSYEGDRKKAIESECYSIGRLSELLKDTDINLIENIEAKYRELVENYTSARKTFYDVKWCDYRFENTKNVQP